MANEIKTPDEVVSPNVKQDEMTLLHNELNRDARRLNVKLGGAEWPHLLLYQEVRQAALNAHADLTAERDDYKAKCEAYEPLLRDALVVIERCKVVTESRADYDDMLTVRNRINKALDTKQEVEDGKR